MTAKDFLKRMPEIFDRDAAQETTAIIQYDLEEPVYQVLESGKLEVFEGQADAPDLIITMADADLIKLFTGELNGMSAFMSGKVKLQGDMILAQRLIGFVDRDKMSTLA